MDAFRLYSFVLLLMLATQMVTSMPDEKRLLKQLFTNYAQLGIVGRPVYNQSETVLVKFGIAVVKLLEMNNMDQTGTFSIWQRFSWNDILLRWDPSEFGGVDHVRVPITKIWRPDIVLYSSVGPETPTIDNAMAVIYSDGTVTWIPPMTVKATCQSDGNFPFDTQYCVLKYGSWTYDGFKLDLDFYDGQENVDLSDYIVDNEWSLIQSSGRKNVKYYPCCVEPYPDITFNMQFLRMSGSKMFLVTLPTVVLFLMILLVFWLHPGAVSKFVIGGVVFLGFLFLMANMTTHYQATKLMIWLGFGMVLTFTAMLTSVISSAVAKKGQSGQTLPRCLSMMCVRVFGLILCGDRPAQKNAAQGSDSKVEAIPDKEMLKQEWVVFAQVMDRIGFLIHLLVMIIMAAKNA